MENSNGQTEKFSVQKLDSFLVVPAEKTPSGLYFLSNLDQTVPYPIDVVFTFKGSESEQGHAAETIKRALAETLVAYYPLAGRLTRGWDGKMMVRCTGDGVPFLEAFSENEMEMLGDISIIDPLKLRKLVHFNDRAESIVDVPSLTVQVTRFKCGGVVLGVAFNHVSIDGRSFTDFVTSWAEIARGLPLSVPPYTDRSILSPRQPPIIDISHDEYRKVEQNSKNPSLCQNEIRIYRSFCFTAKRLTQLKKMVTEGTQFCDTPTNFELISALIWINGTKAFKIQPEKITKLLTAVDGRSKFNPPLPKGYFGNAVAWSCAQCKAGDLAKKSFSLAVKIVHEAIKAVTENYIRSAIDYYEVTRQGLEYENTLYITKWTRLPFYETNFGWGEPVKVAPVSLVDNLVVSHSQGKNSDDIIVSLNLPASAMEIFEELMIQADIKRNI